MTAPSDPAEHVISILESDHPAPESMDWLRAGLRRYVRGCGTLQEALGITESCPRGLRDAVRHARIRRAIVQAADLLPEESTPYSKAKLIRAELLRLRRTWPRCTTRSRMDELLLAAIEAAGPAGPPTSVPRLWAIIDQGIREEAVQADEI